MKAKTIKFLALVLALAFTLSGILCVSAAKYVSKPVLEDFEVKTNFLQPGDIDADGDIDTADYTTLRGIILNGKTDTYSDANGDTVSDIRDLVLQNENADTDFIADGVMNINGKSVYNADITSALNTGAEYKVTFATSGDVTVKLVGLTGAEVTNSGDTFKTPLNLSNADVELYVIGEGTVENLAITRINMDNDYAIN